MRTGCVVGKFWPPHAGHEYLIETAFAGCDELHVIVAARPEERPTGELRARWLARRFPPAHIHRTPDDIPNESASWATRTRELLGRAPDVVFTSEPYGDTWAAELGCVHVCVDLDRRRHPISGTAVRADPQRNWSYLSVPARGYYARRVVLVGAESTGKTTLAPQLAAHFSTLWVPEWARLYGESRGFTSDDWQADEELFALIGMNQPLLETALAEQSNGMVVCDTDLLATLVWHEAYRPDAVEERAALAAAHDAQRASYDSALYLLAVDDTPWVQDGTRNRGADEADVLGSRPWFTRRLRELLTERGESFVELRGSWDERKATAIAAAGL